MTPRPSRIKWSCRLVEGHLPVSCSLSICPVCWTAVHGVEQSTASVFCFEFIIIWRMDERTNPLLTCCSSSIYDCTTASLLHDQNQQPLLLVRLYTRLFVSSNSLSSKSFARFFRPLATCVPLKTRGRSVKPNQQNQATTPTRAP